MGIPEELATSFFRLFKTKVAGSSEMLVTIYWITQGQMPENYDYSINDVRTDELMSVTMKVFCIRQIDNCSLLTKFTELTCNRSLRTARYFNVSL
jgi:hypothetical protein